MFFVFDACHSVNMTKLLSCFVNSESQAVAKYHHKIFLSYGEDSLRSRKKVLRTQVSEQVWRST
eukprot:3854327-Prorocentrum_lima.AAC.1